MPDEARPMSNHEVAKGLGGLLSTLRGDGAATEVLDEETTDEEVLDEIEQPELSDDEGEEVTDEDETEPESTVEKVFEPLPLKVNGVDYLVSDRDEAIKLAQLGKHFTQRNEEVIKKEQAVEQRDEEISDLRSRYLTALPQIEAYLKNPLGEPPQRADYQDETSYLRADKQYRDALSGVQSVQAEIQREQQEMQRQRMKKIEKWAQAEEQATLAVVPEWTDPALRQRETQEMSEYALALGMPQQALANPDLAASKWFRLVLRDAYRYQKAANVGQAEVKRTATKEAAPGTRGQQVTSTQKRSKQMRERARSGKVDDITPLANDLMARFGQLNRGKR